MEKVNVEAIVLRTDDFGDSDRVITLYTREFGKMEANAYGCRRVRNALSGTLLMFNHIKAQLSRGAKVDTITEADTVHFYDALSSDLERLSYGALMFEAVNRLTLPKERDIETFELLRKFLPAVSERNPKIAALIGLVQFMERTGEQLSYSRCVMCGRKITGDAAISLREGGAICADCRERVRDVMEYPQGMRRTFELMLGFDWRKETKINFNSKQLKAADGVLMEYVQSVIGGDLKSLRFIRELEVLRF